MEKPKIEYLGVTVTHAMEGLCGSCSVEISGYRTVGASSGNNGRTDHFILVPNDSKVTSAFAVGMEPLRGAGGKLGEGKQDKTPQP
jgi:hypothetical protein